MLRGLRGSRTQAQKTDRAQGGLVHFIYVPSNPKVTCPVQAFLLFSGVYKTPAPGHLLALQASYIQNQTPCFLGQTPSPDWSKGSSIPPVGHPTNPDFSFFHTPHPTKFIGSTFQKCLDSAAFSPPALCAKLSSSLNRLILLASQLTPLPFKTKSRLRKFSALKILHWLPISFKVKAKVLTMASGLDMVCLVTLLPHLSVLLTHSAPATLAALPALENPRQVLTSGP